MSEEEDRQGIAQRRIHNADLPFVESKLIPQFGLQVGRIRSALGEGVLELFNQYDGDMDPQLLIVVPSILMRAVECALSAELLGSRGRARDVGILLLTLIELRLDLQYMALDLSRVTVWRSHVAGDRKPWSVRKQIRAIFQSQEEQRSEIKIYEQLSTIKHGNPAAGQSAFALSPCAEGLLASIDKVEENLVCAYFYGIGVNLHASIVAAERIVGPAGFRLEGTRRLSDAAHARLSQLNAAHLTRMVKILVSKGSPDARPDVLAPG